MTAHPQWPHTLNDAIAAEIIRWDSNSIGVAYTYKNEDHQMPQLGTEDRAALRRLERAGKLTYVDDDFRERTRRWNGAGLFAARVPANAEMVKAIIPITRSTITPPRSGLTFDGNRDDLG